jgi:hypothetical protein
MLGLGPVLQNRVAANSPVVTEGFERRQRSGIRPDEFLDIQDIAIAWILRTRTSPEWALHPSAALPQHREAITVRDLFEAPIDHSRVCDGNRSAQGAPPVSQTLERPIDLSVYAA